MKRTAAIAYLTLALVGSALAADPASAQDQQLVAIVKEIQAQQIAIADNQTKIDAKLLTVAEAVRTARIYASRGGR